MLYRNNPLLTDDCCLVVTDAWKLLSNFLKTEDAPRSLDLNPKMNSYVRSLDNLLRDALKKDHLGKWIVLIRIWK